MHVMDNISNELMVAQEKYRNIDKEIEKDEKCIKLAQELKFFRQECYDLKHELK